MNKLRSKRLSNTGSASKENQMADWHGFPLSGNPGTGGTIGGEHTVGYYDENGNAQIVNCPSATSPDAPPDANKAPTFHYSTVPATGTPAAVFNSSGICTTAGYVPGGRYYEVGADADHPSDPPAVKVGVASALALIEAGAAQLVALGK